MKLRDKCLPCVVSQAIKIADMVGLEKKEELMKAVFAYLSQMDFSVPIPETMGEILGMIIGQVGVEDPYKEVRAHYNELVLQIVPDLEQRLSQMECEDAFLEAIRYAIIGNIIDFGPMSNTLLSDVQNSFLQEERFGFAIDHRKQLVKELCNAKRVLYIGDNCGEICADKLLLKTIKENNPQAELFFAVREKPFLNDSIAEDAYKVGVDQYATIVENGGGSLGVTMQNADSGFRTIYEKADVVIAKGQANYECYSDAPGNVFFLLMTKCDMIAEEIGVEQNRMVCKKR